jgi:hypothetical protein
LAVAAVSAVEGKCFIHRFLFAFDFDCYALLVKLVLGDARVDVHQHRFVDFDEFVEIDFVLEI